MPDPIRAVLIGAGQRGKDAYGPYALQYPGEIRFVGVAEPDPERRNKFAAQHQIPPENQFDSWEPLLEQPRFGRAALVCTQDRMHAGPTLAALQAGYDVLLEKPMAPTLEETRSLVAAAEAAGQQLHICHVLRYTKHFGRMKEVVSSGLLGDIVNVTHSENVSWFHMAHSYVRGNWRNRAESAPMILAKCCHDLDLLVWLLEDRCDTLSSVGGLIHYRPENAPEGAPKRCLDGCPVAGSCRYYAPMIYVDHIPLWRNFAEKGRGFVKFAARAQLRAPALVKALSNVIPRLKLLSEYQGWPSSTVVPDPTPINLMAALETGPYGRCVYHCDNDVVDHQVVSMRFEGGASVTLTMHGHSHIEGRRTRILGSNATLTAEFMWGNSWIEVNEHGSGRRTYIDTTTSPMDSHGGGDFGLMRHFVQALREGDEIAALTTARISLESHLMAFAADAARRQGNVVRMEDYR